MEFCKAMRNDILISITERNVLKDYRNLIKTYLPWIEHLSRFCKVLGFFRNVNYQIPEKVPGKFSAWRVPG